MQVEEILQTKVTFQKPKIRESMWNKNPRLKAAIEKCLATGEEVYSGGAGDVLFHVRPRYPLIESAMQEPRNKSLLKVTVSVFSPAFSLGVRGDETSTDLVGRDPVGTRPSDAA